LTHQGNAGQGAESVIYSCSVKHSDEVGNVSFVVLQVMLKLNDAALPESSQLIQYHVQSVQHC